MDAKHWTVCVAIKQRAVHLLFSKWRCSMESKDFSKRQWSKKNAALSYYFTYAGPCHCTRSPFGGWLGLIIMWCEGGWGLAALHEEVVVHLLLPWKDLRKNIQDPWWKLGHRQRKWINFSFMPRFTPQLVISLSNSTGDKSRRASARMLHCFSWLFCWLVPPWLGCQMMAQIQYIWYCMCKTKHG